MTEQDKIRWYTKVLYVDDETGEVITKEVAQKKYTIIHKKTTTNVYRQTGERLIINRCRRGQLSLF